VCSLKHFREAGDENVDESLRELSEAPEHVRESGGFSECRGSVLSGLWFSCEVVSFVEFVL